MIKINERQYVAASAIKSIRKPEHYDYITVTTFDGEAFSVIADYGKSIYDKLDELVEAVRKDSEPK